jgi:hypothetical protein
MGKVLGREWWVGCKDVGLCKGDHQLQTPRCRWSSGWALLNVVRGLVIYVYPPPLLLTHHASGTNKGYRSRIPIGPPNGWGGVTNSSGFKGETR